MTQNETLITAALKWRVRIQAAAGYLYLLDQTGNRAVMSKSIYKIEHSGLHDWARDRMRACLGSANNLWGFFKGDAYAVELAEGALLSWPESLALAALWQHVSRAILLENRQE